MRVSRIFFITAHVGILILGYFFVKRYSGLFFTCNTVYYDYLGYQGLISLKNAILNSPI